MSRRVLPVSLAGLLLPLLLAAAPPVRPVRLADPVPDTFSGVARIVAVGDVHGDVEAFKEVLRLAKVIDARGKWIGGKTHLVQTGDVPDRGDRTREAFELLMRLEKEALAAGGRVHALLGNHEVMNMLGDLRYITSGELASFADQSPAPDTEGSKGTNGHRTAYGPLGRYGRWLRTHPAVIRINDTLFVHGGVSSNVPLQTLTEINLWVRRDLFPDELEGVRGGGRDSNGPLWYRGYYFGQEGGGYSAIQRVLQRHGARRMVMGHTTEPDGKIHTRYEGQAVFIDTGISTYAGRHLSALEIRGDTLTALYPDGRVELKD